MNVLLIDHDAVHGRYLARRLPSSLLVTWTPDLAGTVRHLASAPFDALLLGAWPEGPGFRADAVWQAIRRLTTLAPRVPLLVIAPGDDEALARRWVAAGADDVLLKRVATPSAIERALHLAVARRQRDPARAAVAANSQGGGDALSHLTQQFRDTLASLRQLTGAFGDELLGPVSPFQRRQLQRINAKAVDLAALADDLHDVAQQGRGELQVRLAPVALHRLVEKATFAWRQRAEQARVELRIDVAAQLPEVVADEQRLGRVLTQLTYNAIAHAGHGGRVEVWARALSAENRVALGVTDDGPGIQESPAADDVGQGSEGAPSRRAGLRQTLEVARTVLSGCEVETALDSQWGYGSTVRLLLPAIEVLQPLVNPPDEADDRADQPALENEMASFSEGAPMPHRLPGDARLHAHNHLSGPNFLRTAGTGLREPGKHAPGAARP